MFVLKLSAIQIDLWSQGLISLLLQHDEGW